jgi:hypothetical protein
LLLEQYRTSRSSIFRVQGALQSLVGDSLNMFIFQKTLKIVLFRILPIMSLFRLSQTIYSSLFSPTVNFTILNHIHPSINTLSYPLPLHTFNTLSQDKPHTLIPRSVGYMHSVASPIIHPPDKQLHSTSNIITPHDTDSAQDSIHSYIVILNTILNI